MSVAVIVPWAGGCPHRQAAWEWVRAQYADRHPGWEVVEAPGPTPWVKADAVMPAVEATDAEIVVVADADVWCDDLEQAAYAIACDEARWAVPHRDVWRLDEEATARWFDGIYWPVTMGRPPYEGAQGGGIVVAHRDTLLDIPLDRRFVGWGQEDLSWGIALHHLVGPCWRGGTPLAHLWHPPQERVTGSQGSSESMALYRRYCAARNNLAVMRSLVEEGRHGANTPDQPAVRADPPRPAHHRRVG